LCCPKKKFWTKQKTITSPPPFKLNGRSLMCLLYSIWHTGTCFIQKIYAPSSSLLQGKHLPFSSSPLRLTIFRLFVILSLTQLYRYTSEIFLFSTATFKYKYRPPSDELDKNIQRKSHFLFFSHWNGYNHFRFALDFSYAFGIL
jgi:hypothetical protein